MSKIVLYGPELFEVNKTSSKLDIVKYLFNISSIYRSTVSLNVLNEIVNVPSMSLLLNYKNLNGLRRSFLGSIYSNFWREIWLICMSIFYVHGMRNYFDLYDVVLSPKKLPKNNHNLEYPATELAEHIKTLFSCWYMAEKQIARIFRCNGKTFP